ncbi:hypothetical protein J4456_04530 [Candidatus Pacearchaeota archaeon]|nr:hypothetical protein [Candidatus Pacearchaeota archaeon]
MAKNNNGNVLGSWAFLIGVILAVVLGLGFTGGLADTLTWVLVLVGIIVGLLNVADREATPFLMSGAVLVIVSALGGQVLSDVMYVSGILQALLILFVPATIIVAIRNVFSIAKH